MKMHCTRFFLGLFIGLLLISYSNSKLCVDENGDSVDWFIALRVPGAERSYLFLDSRSTKFRVLKENFLEKLFGQIQMGKEKIMAWSDQVPGTKDTASSIEAHSKGFMTVDNLKRGFVLLHSIPRYPEIESNKIDWVTMKSSKYGQSLFCSSFRRGLEEAKEIFDKLKASNVDFYEDDFKFEQKKTRKPFQRRKRFEPTMEMKIGPEVELWTKTRDSRELPYSDMLKNNLKVGWLVQSWGRPLLPSQCSRDKKHAISNIELMRYGAYTWKTTQDHSKWSISTTQYWVCFGDLNRMSSQSKKGGSFLCRYNKLLHSAMKSLILKDQCGFIGK